MGAIMDLSKIRVEELMSSPPIVARKDERVSTVISRIREHGIHELPVVDDGGNLVGHFCYHILVKRKSIPISAKVESVMVSAPHIYKENSVEEALEKLLNTGFRILPVVEKNKVIGVISRTDIVNKLGESQEIRKIPISEIMTRDPIVVYEHSNFDEAINKMKNLGEDAIPVVNDHEKLSGIVYLRDIIRGLWREKSREGYGEMVGAKTREVLRVRDVMLPPVYVHENSTLQDVFDKMKEMSSHIVCVVDDDNKPVGVITQLDILHYVVSKKPREEGVFVQITGLEIEDIVPYEHIYSHVEKFLSHIKDLKRLKPLYLNFHVEEHHSSGGEIKYSVRAKLITESRTFYTKSVDWNVFRAFSEVLDQLERMVKREKERMEETSRVIL